MFIDCNTISLLFFQGVEEATVAKQVLQLSFMGNTGFRFPFAHFPTENTSPGSLMFILCHLVFYCCLDGSECNRSFIKLHFKDVDPVAKHFTTVNPHTRKNFVFIMDPEV